MDFQKKILMFIAPDNFRDAEYDEPRRVFDLHNINTVVGSTVIGTSTGADGMTVTVDVGIGEISPEDYAAIVFVGGPGMVELTDKPEVIRLAKMFNALGKIVAAICVAPKVLANAGLINGKRATAWSGVEKDLKKAGAEFVHLGVVRDGHIITADGPGSARQFGKEIVNALNAV